MADLTAQRTLVKSTPELWSELSEVESLAKHLGELGEIRITKVEPETTVAWEGEQISGTVRLEQSGWGTKVTFHATVPEPGLPEPEPEAAVAPLAPQPEAERQPEPQRERGSFITRWLFRERRAPRAPAALEAEPAVTEPEPIQGPRTVELEPVAIDPSPVATAAETFESPEVERVQQVLDGTLEALGQAHHRPFSRG